MRFLKGFLKKRIYRETLWKMAQTWPTRPSKRHSKRERGGTDMNVKELLLACKDAARELRAIEEQIKRIGTIGGPRERSASVLTMTHSVTNRPDAANNQKIDAYEQVLEEKRQHLVNLLMEFERLLDHVPDTTDRAIMRYYYGSGWTDERISEEEGLTDRTVRARRKKVILQLEYV
jgi:DNA-directed RNA polymerase specialized sigma24 family protein